MPQKGVLFSGTIASNLRFGKDDATDAEIEKAAAIAQATEFIEAKDDKYETAIAQGGTNVSGGQKQRLAIARAIAKDPKIFIFDDSFSALDLKTDAALRKAIRNMEGNPAVFIVSQRTSSIQHADRILVLDDGKAAGLGTHEELISQEGIYKDIYEIQLKALLRASAFGKIKIMVPLVTGVDELRQVKAMIKEIMARREKEKAEKESA